MNIALKILHIMNKVLIFDGKAKTVVITDHDGFWWRRVDSNHRKHC